MLNTTGPARVAVTVAGGSETYSIEANLSKISPDPENPGASGYKWKAFLRPTKAGGDLTITAVSGAWKAEISHVTFGDVFYCSGALFSDWPSFSRTLTMVVAC